MKKVFAIVKTTYSPTYSDEGCIERTSIYKICASETQAKKMVKKYSEEAGDSYWSPTFRVEEHNVIE